MFLLKMCVSCKRELDFQGLGAPKNLSKGVGIPMQYWDAFWHHFFNDFGWFWGGFGKLLGSKSQVLGSQSDVQNVYGFYDEHSEEPCQVLWPTRSREKSLQLCPPCSLSLKTHR